jgi:hypothetical protein
MKKQPKQVNDLAMSPKVAISRIAEGMASIGGSLSALAKALTADLQVDDLSDAVDQLYEVEDALKAMKENIRKRLQVSVEERGEVHTEAGSRKLVVGGWSVEARVGGGGYDDSLVERMLRSKKMPLKQGMDETVSYKSNPSLLEKSGLTEKELKSCQKERRFVLQRPVRVEEK